MADTSVGPGRPDHPRGAGDLADEAFLTGTAAELVPIRSVDDHELGKPGEITRVVQAKFEDALYGRAEEYLEWLDPIEVPAGADRTSKVSS